MHLPSFACCRLPIVVLLAATSGRAADSGIRILTDVAYLESGRSEKLDLYLPPEPAGGRAPAFIWIHGGAFTGGDKAQTREKNVGTILSAAGYVVASINYKLGPGAYPQNIRDCKNAVRFLRTHAGQYGLDPDRIAIGGGSAGGYLCLMAGFTAGIPEFEPDAPYPGVSSKVRAIVDFYGPTDFLTRQQCTPEGVPTGRPRHPLVDSPPVFGVKAFDEAVFRKASPVGRVTEDSPPVLICQGRADPGNDYLQSVELERVLSRHDVPHDLILLDGVGHSFDLTTWNKKPLPRDLSVPVEAFLAKHLGATGK